jgi:hypothetical protein
MYFIRLDDHQRYPTSGQDNSKASEAARAAAAAAAAAGGESDSDSIADYADGENTGESMEKSRMS